MKQDVTVEGIPTKIDHTHNHNVVLEVRVDEYTTRQIKDIATTVIFAGAIAWVAKSLVSTGSKLLLDQNYAKLYPPIKF